MTASVPTIWSMISSAAQSVATLTHPHMPRLDALSYLFTVRCPFPMLPWLLLSNTCLNTLQPWSMAALPRPRTLLLSNTTCLCPTLEHRRTWFNSTTSSARCRIPFTRTPAMPPLVFTMARPALAVTDTVSHQPFFSGDLPPAFLCLATATMQFLLLAWLLPLRPSRPPALLLLRLHRAPCPTHPATRLARQLPLDSPLSLDTARRPHPSCTQACQQAFLPSAKALDLPQPPLVLALIPVSVAVTQAACFRRLERFLLFAQRKRVAAERHQRLVTLLSLLARRLLSRTPAKPPRSVRSSTIAGWRTCVLSRHCESMSVVVWTERTSAAKPRPRLPEGMPMPWMWMSRALPDSPLAFARAAHRFIPVFPFPGLKLVQ